MKHLRGILLLAAVVASATLCAAQTNPPPGAAPSPAQPADFNPNAWQEFSSPEGRFSVLLPGTPKKQVEETDYPVGKAVMHTYSLRTSNQSPEYSLMFTDFPESLDMSDTRELLDAVRDEGVKAIKGRLLEERADNSTGHLGRLYKVLTRNEGVMMIKAFIVKNRFYNLTYTTSVKSKSGRVPKAHQEAASRFLNSFRLLTEQELGAFEGEVDRLLKSLREKGKPAYSLCADTDCKPLEAGECGSKPIFDSGKFVSRPVPAYPAIAKAARAQGTVLVKVVIDEEGKVIAAQAESGHPLLQSAAVAAARGVVLSPTLLDGKPVKFTGFIQYNFSLQ